MEEDVFRITLETFKDGYKGQALRMNLMQIRRDFQYLSLWYARDKQENTAVTTRLYYAAGSPARPFEPAEEIDEAQFKNRKRLSVDLRYDYAWASFQVNDAQYAELKLFDAKTEQAYIPYQVVRTRGQGVDVVKSGTMKGSVARFFQLGIEDNLSSKDFGDVIVYIVMIETYPPADWQFDDSCLGVQRLPVMVGQFRFNENGRYSPWCGNRPL